MNGYELLGNAVVKKAVDDYRKALVKSHKRPDVEKYKWELESLERFFKGETIKIYTKLDGPKLMEMVKQEIIDNGWKIPKRKKEEDDLPE